MEKAVGELKVARDSGDDIKIDFASEALNTLWQAISNELYNATQNASADASAPQGDTNANTSGGDDTKVEDVPYVEVEDYGK